VSPSWKSSIGTLLLLLACSCEKHASEPRIDSEKTLSSKELYMRRSEASAAKVLMANIPAIANQEELCTKIPSGAVGPTPPISVKCSSNPKRLCVPVSSPTEPWEYNLALWAEAGWSTIGFSLEDPHPYHAKLSWDTLEDGSCTYHVQLFGDLDGDGIYSTFEREHPYPEDWSNAKGITNELE